VGACWARDKPGEGAAPGGGRKLNPLLDPKDGAGAEIEDPLPDDRFCDTPNDEFGNGRKGAGTGEANGALPWKGDAVSDGT